MFTNKFYSRLYFSIIKTAIERNWSKALGRERHHIIPHSIGGSNDKTNLVYVTGREHLICHWLLLRMTEGNSRSKMLYAFMGMRAENKFQNRYHTKITARIYEKYRIEHAANHSKTMKGRTAHNKGTAMSDEQKQKLRIAATGKKHSAETIAKRSASVRGTKRSEETKRKMSLAAKGKPKGPMSEEQKLKRSLKQKGIKKSKSHAENIKKANLGVVSINKDGIEKKVKRDSLQRWLTEGWQLGGRKRRGLALCLSVC